MKKGFTLIELIVVIAIIAILAAIIAPNAFKAIEKSKVSKAISDFKSFKTAFYALYADTGHWPLDGKATSVVLRPNTNTDLDVNFSNWAGWDGPYLEKILSMHPWHGTYYMCYWHNFGQGAANEMWIEFEDTCYPSGPNGGCPVPRDSQLNIDRTIDDGDIATGDVRGGGDLHWIMLWDYQ